MPRTKALVAWAPATLWAAFLFYLSSRSTFPSTAYTFLGDKPIHVILFAVLGTALAWGARGWHRQSSQVVLVLTGVAFAATDEWHQSMVPRRDASLADFGADVLGIVAAFLLARWLLGRVAPWYSEVQHR